MDLAQGGTADPWEMKHTFTQGERVARRQLRKGRRGLWERAPHTGQRAGPGRTEAVVPPAGELGQTGGLGENSLPQGRGLGAKDKSGPSPPGGAVGAGISAPCSSDHLLAPPPPTHLQTLPGH